MSEQQTAEQQKVTHWKKLTNPNYIGSHDFQPGQELKVTIDKVVQEKVKGMDGKDKDCIVAYIVGAKKPLILNKTNCKIISRLHDTPYIEEWQGKVITLYVAKVSAFGDNVDAIRVKARN
jgi:hypothetical protein